MKERNKIKTKRNALNHHQFLTYQDYVNSNASQDTSLLNLNAWFVLFLYSLKPDTEGFDN